MEIIDSNKRGSKLCYNGFMYTKHVTRKTKLWWKCVKRSSGQCRGSMSTSLQRQHPEPGQPHNHAPDHTQIRLAKVRNWMKDQAVHTRVSPAQIFSHGVSQCDDAVRSLMPAAEICKRTMRNRIQKVSVEAMSSWLSDPIKGVLLDITGVLYESGEGFGTAIPGSVEAVEKLRKAGIPVRFVTNETCATRTAVVMKLRHHNFTLSEDDVFSPVPAVISVLKERGLVPHTLIHPAIEDDFKEMKKGSPTCVVLGDADEAFSFANMNEAFRTLMNMEEPKLFSLGLGKYYKHKGQLQLDVGAYATALEFACDIKCEVIGKPSPLFFGAALNDIGITANEAVMIGDDIVSDVGGSQKCGLRGVLVRTGKYTSACENHPLVKPHFIANNLLEAVDMIVQAQKKD